MSCGDVDLAPSPASSSAIVYGTACTDPAASSTVALLFRGRVSYGGPFTTLHTVLCSGVVIAPDAVLTAAHCLELAAQGIVEVEAAGWFVSDDEDVRAVFDEQAPFPEGSVAMSSSWIHPEFNAASFLEAEGLAAMHDVGIAFLESSLEGVAPALLLDDEDALAVGSGVTVVGYGSTDAQGAVPGVTGQRRCGFSFVNDLADDEMQIGSGTASVRRCSVDSGGATLLGREGISFVVGLGSRSFSSGCGQGGIDTRLDVLRADVEAALVTACDEGVRSACDPPGLRPPLMGDAGVAGDLDAADSADAGAVSDEDAGSTADAGSDAGQGGAPPSCSCSATSAKGLDVSALVALYLFLRRRRARP